MSKLFVDGINPNINLTAEPNLYNGSSIIINSHTTDNFPQWQNKLAMDLENGKTYTIRLVASSTNGISKASFRIWEFNNDQKIPYQISYNADGLPHQFVVNIPNDNAKYGLYLYAGELGVLAHKDFSTTYHKIGVYYGTNPIEIDLAALRAKLGGWQPPKPLIPTLYTISESEVAA